VENAIEIAYRAVSEANGRRVFLLSEMIHNPKVNQDLLDRGIRFLQDTEGRELISLSELTANDIVVVPAFGTSIEMFDELRKRGVDAISYNTTCPFVEKVWKRAEELGRRGFTVVIHGKHSHEETRATFSHARQWAQSLVVRNAEETRLLCDFIEGRAFAADLFKELGERMTAGFNPEIDLQRIGVVNQTTMLAEETHEISELIRKSLRNRYGDDAIKEHFADTRDTLCYATSENQRATRALLATDADLALIVGGYNSSNTSHLYELCAEKYPSFFIKDSEEIISIDRIRHLDFHAMKIVETEQWLPSKRPVNILVTAGASCPDALVDEVLRRVNLLAKSEVSLAAALEKFGGLLNSSPAQSLRVLTE
jgi:4-hydroxy-3-methylbut-2-enyl diphosphate reductase